VKATTTARGRWILAGASDGAWRRERLPAAASGLTAVSGRVFALLETKTVLEVTSLVGRP
jgi:hypothetical protein